MAELTPPSDSTLENYFQGPNRPLSVDDSLDMQEGFKILPLDLKFRVSSTAKAVFESPFSGLLKRYSHTRGSSDDEDPLPPGSDPESSFITRYQKRLTALKLYDKPDTDPDQAERQARAELRSSIARNELMGEIMDDDRFTNQQKATALRMVSHTVIEVGRKQPLEETGHY